MLAELAQKLPGGGSLAARLRKISGRLEDLLRETAGQAPAELVSALETAVSGGKRLRPLLAFVCHGMGGGKWPILPLMAMVELMHTASLLHDDIVDGSLRRRGAPSALARLGPEGAAACGDYLLGAAMAWLPVYRGSGINERLSLVSVEMCRGELQQRRQAGGPQSLELSGYFQRADRKTACLISACCYGGGVAGGLGEGACLALSHYGLLLGRAFQMTDDLLDVEPSPLSGKPGGQDLRGGIGSLPVILALNSPGGEAWRPLFFKKEKSRGEIQRLLQFIRDSGMIPKARELVEDCCRQAARALEVLPPSMEKKALGLLAEGLSGREK